MPGPLPATVGESYSAFVGIGPASLAIGWARAHFRPVAPKDGTVLRNQNKSGTPASMLTHISVRGAREHNLPVIRNAEQYTFYDASQAVIDDYIANKPLQFTQRIGTVDTSFRQY